MSSPWERICSIAAIVDPPVGDRVLDHEDLRPGLDRALDHALEAVCLALLADEEADQALAARHGDRGAGQRNRGHHGATDRLGAELDCPVGDQLAGRQEARRPHHGPARIDVVLRRLPAGQGHLADDERVLAQLGEERLPRVRGHRLNL